MSEEDMFYCIFHGLTKQLDQMPTHKLTFVAKGWEQQEPQIVVDKNTTI